MLNYAAMCTSTMRFYSCTELIDDLKASTQWSNGVEWETWQQGGGGVKIHFADLLKRNQQQTLGFKPTLQPTRIVNDLRMLQSGVEIFQNSHYIC